MRFDECSIKRFSEADFIDENDRLVVEIPMILTLEVEERLRKMVASFFGVQEAKVLVISGGTVRVARSASDAAP